MPEPKRYNLKENIAVLINRGFSNEGIMHYLDFNKQIADCYEVTKEDLIDVIRDLMKNSKNNFLMEGISCSFTSVWEDGAIVTTPCIYNPNTGVVSPVVSKGPIPEGALLREYITLPTGEKLEVCSTCHEYVLKTAGECQECTNPDCSDEE